MYVYKQQQQYSSKTAAAPPIDEAMGGWRKNFLDDVAPFDWARTIRKERKQKNTHTKTRKRFFFFVYFIHIFRSFLLMEIINCWFSSYTFLFIYFYYCCCCCWYSFVAFLLCSWCFSIPPITFDIALVFIHEWISYFMEIDFGVRGGGVCDKNGYGNG